MNYIIAVDWINYTISDIKYSYLVDQQPIGRVLFRKFCQDHKQSYHRYNIFLDSIEKYEIELDENRLVLAKDLFEKYLRCESSEVVNVLNDSLISQCEERLCSGSRELFVEVSQTVKNFLAGEPFSEFLNSFYFYRFVIILLINVLKIINNQYKFNEKKIIIILGTYNGNG